MGADKTIYRPSVMFLYSPCKHATDFLQKSKVSEHTNTEIDKSTADFNNAQNIIRGYKYPNNWEILYPEKITSGTEYVGVLLLGNGFDPVWVGNRIERKFLEKDKKSSYWQTPTITPVAMSALAATCWMIKNKKKARTSMIVVLDNFSMSELPKDLASCKSVIQTGEISFLQDLEM